MIYVLCQREHDYLEFVRKSMIRDRTFPSDYKWLRTARDFGTVRIQLGDSVAEVGEWWEPLDNDFYIRACALMKQRIALLEQMPPPSGTSDHCADGWGQARMVVLRRTCCRGHHPRPLLRYEEPMKTQYPLSLIRGAISPGMLAQEIDGAADFMANLEAMGFKKCSGARRRYGINMNAKPGMAWAIYFKKSIVDKHPALVIDAPKGNVRITNPSLFDIAMLCMMYDVKVTVPEKFTFHGDADRSTARDSAAEQQADGCGGTGDPAEALRRDFV